MLRVATLAIVLSALISAPAAATAGVARPPASLPAIHSLSNSSLLNATVVEEVNRVRAAHGLRPLRPVRSLAVGERRHSTQMDIR